MKNGSLHSWTGCIYCVFVGSLDGYDVHKCGSGDTEIFQYFVIGDSGLKDFIIASQLGSSEWRDLIESVIGDDDPSVSPNARKVI